ncbi:Putative membrane protein [Cronobacter condimenti 1330]|uniref:Putative membrane protein n=1 Tax=Cronobacter condimenti 1330 TaxID=1073999 RepID=K8A0E3_9ENTR|nr:Putative membrane protein [Cronobacter condimenti 1330]
MKSYLINRNCIFSEAKNLKNTDNACVIKMTTMRARCLSFIIENAGNGVIEKQQIAAVLWGNRGQYVSDANLTQVLYLLRRDLRSLGINELFVTIPKLGIKVNDDVPVDLLTEENKKKPKRAFWTVAAFAVFVVCVLALLTLADVSNP